MSTDDRFEVELEQARRKLRYAEDDAAYWRVKYEGLIESLGPVVQELERFYDDEYDDENFEGR